MPLPENLLAMLATAIPKAVAWAIEEEAAIGKAGTALTPAQLLIVTALGVKHPNEVRIQFVSQIHQPPDPQLAMLSSAVGLVTSETAGITFGHSIYIRTASANDRELFAHELVHVMQCEKLGGIAQFIKTYCGELAHFGYWDAPLEVQARALAKQFK